MNTREALLDALVNAGIPGSRAIALVDNFRDAVEAERLAEMLRLSPEERQTFFDATEQRAKDIIGGAFVEAASSEAQLPEGDDAFLTQAEIDAHDEFLDDLDEYTMPGGFN